MHCAGGAVISDVSLLPWVQKGEPQADKSCVCFLSKFDTTFNILVFVNYGNVWDSILCIFGRSQIHCPLDCSVMQSCAGGYSSNTALLYTKLNIFDGGNYILWTYLAQCIGIYMHNCQCTKMRLLFSTVCILMRIQIYLDSSDFILRYPRTWSKFTLSLFVQYSLPVSALAVMTLGVQNVLLFHPPILCHLHWLPSVSYSNSKFSSFSSTLTL